MRVLAGGVVAGLVLLMASIAQAARVDWMPTWAWSWVDDQPFVDPNTGAPLPPNSVYPRGQLKDRGTPDCCAVKMTITSLGAGGRQLHQYTVTDGDAVYRTLDRRLDLSAPVQSVRFDLCKADNSACETKTFTRPAPAATPTPQPGSTPTPVPQPMPVDRDGDGFPDTTDCNDTNDAVHPGAKEYAGNEIDDDCVGGDQAAKMPGTVKYDFESTPRTNPRVKLMRVRDALPGAQVTVHCQGKGCQFKLRRRTTDRFGEVSLTKLFKRRLAHRTRLEVHIAAEHMITKVTRFDIRRGKNPRSRSLCIPPGKLKPQRRC
jgi:hypothetical protein